MNSNLKQNAYEKRQQRNEVIEMLLAPPENVGIVYNRGVMDLTKGSQVRVGGSKGKEGRADHTAGKRAFKRPCTVGWKSQNQPLQRGGGNKTPL